MVKVNENFSAALRADGLTEGELLERAEKKRGIDLRENVLNQIDRNLGTNESARRKLAELRKDTEWMEKLRKELLSDFDARGGNDQRETIIDRIVRELKAMPYVPKIEA